MSEIEVMLLSLSDVLATQSLEKPQSQLRTEVSALSASGINFKDYLNRYQNGNPVKTTHQFAAKAEVASSVTRPVLHNISYSKAPLNNADSDNQAKAELDLRNTNLGHAAEAAGINVSGKPDATHDLSNDMPVTKSSLFAAVSQLQRNGAGIPDDVAKLLNEIIPKLDLEGVPSGISATDIVSHIITKISDANAGGVTINADAVLQNINLAEISTPQAVTAGQMAAAALAMQPVLNIDLGKVAAKVIEVAKAEAEKPQFSASDLRMANIASLSSLNKKRTIGDSQKDFDTQVGLRLAAEDINALVNAKAGQQQDSATLMKTTLNKDQQLPGQNNLAGAAVSTGLMQPQSVNVNKITNVVDGVKQVVNDALGSGVTQTAKLDTAGDNSLPASLDNFVKFQNLLQNTHDAVKNTATKMHNIDEIMAQIKFGMQDIGGKDESNISIQLHPKELGKVDITMQIGHDGKTQVMIVAEKTDTLNLLQKEASSLKDMLTDALKTDSGNLNFSFHERASDGWGRQFANNQYNSGLRTPNNLLSDTSQTGQGYLYNMIGTQGLDIRV